MSNESPFLNFKVECPVCKTINEFEQIKVGAYVEETRDSDFCPQDIKWRYPKYQAYNPLAFFTATCSHCFYTREFTNKFREWKADNAFRTYRLKTVKTKHLEYLSEADSVLKSLGNAIDMQRYPNESAIIKLHLAVFDELCNEHPSNLDLGRFYLRIGWVFRSLGANDNPSQLMLGSLLREMDSKYFSFKEALEHARGQFDALGASIAAQFEADQMPAEVQSQMCAYRDRFEAGNNALDAALTGGREKLEEMRTLMDGYRAELMGSSQVEGEQQFGQYPSFGEFLRQEVKWDGRVASEREALEKAAHYYKQAFAGGRDIAPGTPQIQVSYLIAELSRRVGDYDEAKQFFTSTIKTGQEFIYQNRRDQSRTALARKILELAIEQGRANLAASKPA